MKAKFSDFAETCEKIRGTSSKLAKVATLASFLKVLDDEDLKIAARFFCGRAFPGYEEGDVGVGYATLASVIRKVTGASREELRAVYFKYGDLGSAAEELLSARKAQAALLTEPLTLAEVYSALKRAKEASGPGSASKKTAIVTGLLLRCSPLEAKYLIKILTGEMRIGLVEGLVEESIAEAFGAALEDVRKAHMLVGDIGDVAELAKKGRVREARLVPMRPVNFMLASAALSAEEVVKQFGKPFFAEFKYDGVRCQVHKVGSVVKIFSRNLRDVTDTFPEVAEAVRRVPHDFIIDGEILGFRDEKPLPFKELQRRLQRRATVEQMAKEVPVALFAYDLLMLDGEDMFERPLRERRELLESIGLQPPLYMSHLKLVESVGELREYFELSRELGYEGLVAKDPDSPYMPGRRGKLWQKLKSELDTLDVVIVAAEYGHGKRAGLLSDYTFAVRAPDGLKVVGKAYSGLTDDEIEFLTKKLKEIAIAEGPGIVYVRPEIVLEVAFDGIQRSDRHDSGFALRFPRIKKIRTDKSPDEIDDIDRVKEIYERSKER